MPVTSRHRLDDVQRLLHSLGNPAIRTDCVLPMLWAGMNRVEVDTFVIYTDNETWARRIHPTQALRQYRERMGIDARLAVCAMTSIGFTIADPTDAGQLDLVGFDGAVPHLLSEFSRGNVCDLRRASQSRPGC